MLKKIREFFDSQLSVETENPQQVVNKAACALLFEMIRADYEVTDQELAAMRKAMIKVMGINDAVADELISMAEQEMNDASDYYQFTRLINEHYDEEQKYQLVQSLWMVAYADGNLDKYEEHYMRRISDLLYIPHARFIQAKLEVQQHFLKES